MLSTDNPYNFLLVSRLFICELKNIHIMSTECFSNIFYLDKFWKCSIFEEGTNKVIEICEGIG